MTCLCKAESFSLLKYDIINISKRTLFLLWLYYLCQDDMCEIHWYKESLKSYIIRVSVEPRKSWNFIFEIPGLRSLRKNEIIHEMSAEAWNFVKPDKKGKKSSQFIHIPYLTTGLRSSKILFQKWVKWIFIRWKLVLKFWKIWWKSLKLVFQILQTPC